MVDYCGCPSCAYRHVRAVRVEGLPIFVIFDKPIDQPSSVIVRLFVNDKPTTYTWSFSSVANAREAIPESLGLVVVPRSEEDHVSVVESWV